MSKFTNFQKQGQVCLLCIPPWSHLEFMCLFHWYGVLSSSFLFYLFSLWNTQKHKNKITKMPRHLIRHAKWLLSASSSTSSSSSGVVTHRFHHHHVHPHNGTPGRVSRFTQFGAKTRNPSASCPSASSVPDASALLCPTPDSAGGGGKMKRRSKGRPLGSPALPAARDRRTQSPVGHFRRPLTRSALRSPPHFTNNNHLSVVGYAKRRPVAAGRSDGAGSPAAGDTVVSLRRGMGNLYVTRHQAVATNVQSQHDGPN